MQSNAALDEGSEEDCTVYSFFKQMLQSLMGQLQVENPIYIKATVLLQSKWVSGG